MKTLLILRHGKAENKGKAAVATDRPRHLTARGESEATAIGGALRRRGLRPDRIVSSDATRAYETANLAAAELDQAAPVELDPAIYDANNAEGSDLLVAGVLVRLPDAAGCLLLVGHNPGLENLVADLTGESVALPTGGLACVTLPVDHWGQARAGSGTLVWTEAPD